MTYNWQATLILLATLTLVTVIGNRLVKQVRAFDGMRAVNREEDKHKVAKDKYPPVVASTRKIGAITNLVFYSTMVPFIVT
ncbi:hypothetical protein, partial [Litorivivens sp.]|uniref:hypothetical protein n=1 Tax=Litorivivens sp. TaxID=2020868 RepID=UPI00356B5870